MVNEKLYTKEELEREYKRGEINGKVEIYHGLLNTLRICIGQSFETGYMLLLKEIESIKETIKTEQDEYNKK